MAQDLIPGSAIPFSAPAVQAGGINGLGSLRFVGTTNGGAPTSGTYQTGDVALDLNSLVVWVCTSGGSPGTWQGFSYLRTDSSAPNPQLSKTSLGVPGGVGSFPGFYFNSQAASGFNPGINLGIFVDSSGAMGFNVGNAQRAYIMNAGTMIGNLVMSLSGGYKVQSGQTPPPSTSTGSNLISVTFPVSFTSTPQIIVTPELSNPQVLSYSLANPSSTGFNIAYYNSSTPTNFVAFHWVAIGS